MSTDNWERNNRLIRNIDRSIGQGFADKGRGAVGALLGSEQISVTDLNNYPFKGAQIWLALGTIYAPRALLKTIVSQ